MNSFLDPNNRENDMIEERWYQNQLDTTNLQQAPRQHNGQGHYWSIAEYKLRADIPSFGAGFNIEEFIDWVNEVERFFEFMDISEETKVKLVAYKLKGGACGITYLFKGLERIGHQFASGKVCVF